jgi:hypothetical protein
MTAMVTVTAPPAKAHAQASGGKKQYDDQDRGYLTENGQGPSLREITENIPDDKYHAGYK